jgi:uncharacterized membrane protein
MTLELSPGTSNVSYSLTNKPIPIDYRTCLISGAKMRFDSLYKLGGHMNWSRSMLALNLISGFAAVGMQPAHASGWVDTNPPAASQCGLADINDGGTFVENCLVSNAPTPYLTVLGTQSALGALSSTVGGVPCVASAINNQAPGQETIIGNCGDGKNVPQAVVWRSSEPSKPERLRPDGGFLGILGVGVKTVATSVNRQGIVVGGSIDANNSGIPVVWSPEGVESPLRPALFETNLNCSPLQINDATTPSIVGNCPAGALGSGGNKAVLWASPTSLYTALPVPEGASYCRAGEINLNGQIIGQCFYPAAVSRAVQWGIGGTGPTVLMSVDGNATNQSMAADENDLGRVVINYMSMGSQSGLSKPAYWDPSNMNQNATGLALPGQVLRATVSGIANSGLIVGTLETPQGSNQLFYVFPRTYSIVNAGSPEGGPNSSATAISPSGNLVGADAENAEEKEQAVTETFP